MTTSIAKLLILLSISAAGLAQDPPHLCDGCGVTSSALPATSGGHVAMLPYQAKINGNTWTIKQFDRPTDFKDDDGYTSCPSHTIYWRKPKYQTTQWIIWHELLHAGACFGTLYDGHYWDNPNIKKHDGIYRLTIFLYEVTRDNPELAQWLIGGSK